VAPSRPSASRATDTRAATSRSIARRAGGRGLPLQGDARDRDTVADPAPHHGLKGDEAGDSRRAGRARRSRTRCGAGTQAPRRRKRPRRGNRRERLRLRCPFARPCRPIVRHGSAAADPALLAVLADDGRARRREAFGQHLRSGMVGAFGVHMERTGSSASGRSWTQPSLRRSWMPSIMPSSAPASASRWSCSVAVRMTVPLRAHGQATVCAPACWQGSRRSARSAAASRGGEQLEQLAEAHDGSNAGRNRGKM